MLVTKYYAPHTDAQSASSTSNHRVEDIAEKFNLRSQKVGGKTEWHGPNPFEPGATKDGFILYPEGNAFDRSTQVKYTRGEVARLAGMSAGPTFPRKSPKASKPRLDWATATTYDYTDESGKLLFQVGRSGSGESKQVSQRRPDGQGGWLWSIKGVRRVLYRLADVVGADVVFLCEGEKTADSINKRLKDIGFYGEYVATTTSGGAGNSHQTDYAEHLSEKMVGVLPDNDAPGEAQGQAHLEKAFGQASIVKRIELPNLPDKGDADDFFACGGDIESLLAIFEESPVWEKPKPKPRFNLLSVPELFERPDPQFLVEQWLVQSTTVLFTGKYGSCKTFATIDLGACIATGKPWHGFRVLRPGTVVYIAAEGAAGIKRRLQAWLQHHSETIRHDRFFVIDMPMQIANDDDRRAFIEQVKALAPSFIVFDTLARCTVGLDENSASDMGKVSDALGEMARETGACCMVVHHNNKMGDYRGSSALPSNVDTHLSIEKKEDVVTLSIEKQKDFEKHKPVLFEATPVVLSDTGGEINSLVLCRMETRAAGTYTMSDIAQRALDAFIEVFKDDHISSSKWARAVDEQKGISGSNFFRAQAELLEKKIVKMVSGKKGGKGKEAPLYAVELSWLPSNSEVTPQAPESSGVASE